MTDHGKLVAAAELAPDTRNHPPRYDASGFGQDLASVRADHLERARTLGRRLSVEVVIDATGWLRGDIELVYTREHGGALRPLTVRVGHEALDDDLLTQGGVIGRCEQYNDTLERLRQLGARLAELVTHGRVSLVPGSAVEYAHRELSRLDELIARRQGARMGHRAVRLKTLVRETEFLARCDAHLTPIVMAAEQAIRATEPRDTPRSRALVAVLSVLAVRVSAWFARKHKDTPRVEEARIILTKSRESRTN
jgi:hypothetical protein